MMKHMIAVIPKPLCLSRQLALGGCLPILCLAATLCPAQVSGNIAYGQAGQNGARARAEQSERTQRILTEQDLPPTDNTMFLDAGVLMNVKADEYVAVFGIAEEGATVEESGSKMDATLKKFTDALKPLHIGEHDLYVDSIAQPRTYSYDVADNTAREKASGFELKKNISIRYTAPALLDKIVLAASRAQIYDLIKVDYIVKDTSVVQAALMVEASAVIKQKLARYEKLLNVKVEPNPTVYAERPAIHYPTEMYDSYNAAESEAVRPRNLDRYTIVQARRTRTFFFNPLSPSGFDKVINPVVLDPVVQFTLYLKLRYRLALPPEAAGQSAPPPPHR